MSPGIVGLYWLAGSFIAAGLWSIAATRLKRASHNHRARCYCGTCTR